MKITEKKLRSIIRNLILEVDDSIEADYSIYEPFEDYTPSVEDDTMVWPGDIVTDFEIPEDREVNREDMLDPEYVTPGALNRLRQTQTYEDLDQEESESEWFDTEDF